MIEMRMNDLEHRPAHDQAQDMSGNEM